MHHLATVDTSMHPQDEDRETYRVTNDTRWVPYDTYASEEFCRDGRFSREFRHLVARCMAVDFDDRPSLLLIHDTCIRNIERTPNWLHLEDEVNELFDFAPTSGAGDDDYESDSDDGDGSDGGHGGGSDRNDGWVRGFVLRSEAGNALARNAQVGNAPVGNAPADSPSVSDFSLGHSPDSFAGSR